MWVLHELQALVWGVLFVATAWETPWRIPALIFTIIGLSLAPAMWLYDKTVECYQDWRERREAEQGWRD